MTYLDAAQHWLTYAIVVAGICYIVFLTVFHMRKSWKRALEIGYTKKQLRKVVKSSASYTLIPAIAILVGFFNLAPTLGIPLSWWRLSVIGNTVYEIMAADIALNASGVANVAEASAKEFVLVMSVMAIGIMGSMVISVLIAKKIQSGVFKIRQRDPRWSALGNSTFITTVLIVLTIPYFFRVSVALLTLVTGAAVSLALRPVIRKTGLAWLNDFSLAISMLTAMASSVMWTSLLA
jgi:hypothetical protein